MLTDLDQDSHVGAVQDITFALGHLGVESFYVVGVSGGGPYALACAAFRSDMVKGVMLISAAGNPGTVWPAVPHCNCHIAAGVDVQCMQPSCDHKCPLVLVMTAACCAVTSVKVGSSLPRILPRHSCCRLPDA